jgi:hypothetical protein
MHKPPYKNSINNWYGQVLFLEIFRSLPEKDRPLTMTPVFTLNEDRDGYINARKTFIEEGDPTGYKWAIKYLGDWDHFVFLSEREFFKTALAKWRAELQLKLTAEAIDRIKAIAESDDKQALVANKYLAERPWEKVGSTRGRPSKAEVQGALKQAVRVVEQEDEDMARIGLLKVVK